jgi:hypothetical protein
LSLIYENKDEILLNAIKVEMLSEYMFLAKCFFLVCDQEMDEPQFTSP